METYEGQIEHLIKKYQIILCLMNFTFLIAGDRITELKWNGSKPNKFLHDNWIVFISKSLKIFEMTD